jgi:hypothetical protein
VTGKFVQIFTTYGATTNGQPSRRNVLVGHAQPITDLHWNGSGQGLHTTDSGGAVYEWLACKPDRVREVLMSRQNISAVGGSLHDGCLIATGGGKREKQKEEFKKKQEKDKNKPPTADPRASRASTGAGGNGGKMFNPQTRQAIQKNRKKSMAMKKQNMLVKVKTLSRMNLLAASAEKKVEQKKKEERPVATLMGWENNIESSKAAKFNLFGRVTAIIATKNDDYERNKVNHAFVCTGDGEIMTFEFGNVVGRVKPEDVVRVKDDRCGEERGRSVGLEGGQRNTNPHTPQLQLASGEVRVLRLSVPRRRGAAGARGEARVQQRQHSRRRDRGRRRLPVQQLAVYHRGRRLHRHELAHKARGRQPQAQAVRAAHGGRGPHAHRNGHPHGGHGEGEGD